MLVRAVLPRMIQRGNGHIVIVHLIKNADRHAYQENGSYSAARYGGRGLHEVMRAELRGTGGRGEPCSATRWIPPVWTVCGPGGAARGSHCARLMLAADDVAAAVLYAVSQPPRGQH